ncbi:MAG: YggS family pyridoxal phosphate-dependent enzyme [Clostridia bacterium]|nr:YggS family pyridoxal phosphate-dependent enzyme [Clostridia bacterium]
MTQNSSIDFDLSYLDENYKRVTSEISEAAIKAGRAPEEVSLMAVTKTVSPVMINHMISLGAKLIGENKVQELLSKLDFLDTKDIKMHIIGHLQSNKVRKIIDTVSMIQSVDSVSLAEEISRQAVKHEKEMDILLEVNIGDEEAKTGMPIGLLKESACEIAEMPGIKIKGLMCVPPICENDDEARRYFEKTRLLYEDLKVPLKGKSELSVLSMGMSSDFVPAILEGATIVRVGSSLFGARRY